MLVFGQQVTNLKNFDIALFKFKDTTRKQDDMLLCIILDVLEDSKNHPESKGMLWMVD